MKKFKALFVVLCLAIPIALGMAVNKSNAWVDGSQYADAHVPIIFGWLIAADTLSSVRCLSLNKEITYFIKVTSRHNSGAMSSDTVYAILAGSADDSTYTNLSSTGATLTYTALGTYAITFDLLASYRYVRLEIPRMTDSLRVDVKAVVSGKEN
jgi:hypothetical protein